MAEEDDAIKRDQMLRQAMIVALGSLAAGAAVEIPTEADADSMIHLHIISGSRNGTEKHHATRPTNGPKNPQDIGIVVVEHTPPPDGGYKVLKDFTHTVYYRVANPYIHGKADKDPDDAAVPFASTTAVWIAVGWN